MIKTKENPAYVQLCQAAHIEPNNQATSVCLKEYTTIESMATHSVSERLQAGLSVLIELLIDDEIKREKIDKVLIDYFIGQIDEKIGLQLDEILHHPYFQSYESRWRGLKHLIDHTDFRCNSKVEVLDVSKETLKHDFDTAVEFSQSGLYRHVYNQEYDTPGGEPISAMISDYQFNSDEEDIELLKNIASVGSAAHCPFIAGVSSQFFKKSTFEEVLQISDLTNYLERSEFIAWNSFRELNESRYIGLTLPRFLLRLPYSAQGQARPFVYEEQVAGENAEKYLWGSASFAFAANMAISFKKYGWTVNVRGPEGGGKVEHLPLHHYNIGFGLQTKIPTEGLISETLEVELSQLGFIPLTYYKNSDFACFFSANSAQRPASYVEPAATANARINSRLPYVFLSARLGHYLKVVQRENIGLGKNRLELETELNNWLRTLITKMNKPGPELSATHPLRDGKIVVEDIEENPGFYRVLLYATPHFQVEGLDVQLSLVGQLPKGIEKQGK